MKIVQISKKTEQIKASLFFSNILALIVVVLWIAVSIYFAYTKKSVDQDMEALLSPLNPTLDIETWGTYRDGRFIPATEFEIMVKSKNNEQTKEYRLDPFANKIQAISPDTPVASAAPAASE